MTEPFRDTVEPYGLTGVFSEVPADTASPGNVSQVTPYVTSYWHTSVIPIPYSATWTGTLEVPTAGEYSFLLSGNGELRLSIDNKLVAESGPVGSPVESKVSLAAGYQSIRVDYSVAQPPSEFKIRWIPPSGQPDDLPIQLLAPEP